MPHELLGLPYSPWSEKARWALELRGVPYVSRTYEPLLGEPALRMKLGRWRGVVSVPVLTDDAGVALADSHAIARWANERGSGPDLFPPAHDAEIRVLVDASERGLAAGRVLSLRRLLLDREGLAEMVPRALRGLPLTISTAAMGVRRTISKYGGEAASAEHERALTEVLDGLRARLARATGSPKFVLGDHVTFGDVAIAQVLAFVKPPATGLKIGAASRKAFTDDAFSARYADLVAWRDALYAAHR